MKKFIALVMALIMMMAFAYTVMAHEDEPCEYHFYNRFVIFCDGTFWYELCFCEDCPAQYPDYYESGVGCGCGEHN